jgi:hypothetical protein
MSAAVTATTTPVATTAMKATTAAVSVEATTVSVEPAVEADTYPWIPAAIATPWTVRAAIVITRRVVAIVIGVTIIAVRDWPVGNWRIIPHSTVVIDDCRPLVITRSVHATAQHEDADH